MSDSTLLVRSAMADVSGDGGAMAPEEVTAAATATSSQPLTVTVSGSFKEGKSSSRRRASVRPSLDADEFLNLLHGSDPVKVELNRLENEVRGAKMQFDPMSFELIFIGVLIVSVCMFVDKDRELSEAQAEIKALRLSERLREKAVEEVISKFRQIS